MVNLNTDVVPNGGIKFNFEAKYFIKNKNSLSICEFVLQECLSDRSFVPYILVCEL